jgi:2-C-methyl-D-erythritol 4-phosphate cytidylyltransferase
VLNGLQSLQAHGARDSDWVLVHDAARCLIQAAWVNALIDACHADPVGGLLALPVADTLKQAKEGRVAASVDRAHKWQAQTPQMFRIGMLNNALSLALASGAANITDESSALEMAGHAPLLVAGSLENFKVTYPSDFELAEKLLRMRP